MAKRTAASLQFFTSSAMAVSYDGALIGCVAVSDPIRPEAKEMLSRLRDEGIGLGIISGDNSRTVNAIATELGIDNVVPSTWAHPLGLC